MDELTPNRIWSFIDAWNENEKEQWERTRVIAYTVAKFGNSDPKKFPKKMQRFFPFPWDKAQPKTDAKTILEQHAKMKAIREELLKKQKK